MLAIVVFIYLIVIIFKSRDIKILRRALFTLSVVLCLFFFSSNDPFINIQLYIYPMMLSIIISLFANRRINISALATTLVLIICLLIPIIMIQYGMINGRFLLLKQSNTDVLDIQAQLFKPTVNFTVIKHFVYLIAYILFVVLNNDLYDDNKYIEKLIKVVIFWFKILIVCLIVEWAFVNAFGGYNDRQLMNVIFSLHGTNQSTNWLTWGSHSVCLWFTERSVYSIIAIFYLVMLKKETLRFNDWLWIVLSAVACYCTGSSSTLVIIVVYMAAEFIITIIKNKKISQISAMSIIAVCGLFILINYYSVYAPKLIDFFNNANVWGSAHFRAQSIEYGLKAIKEYPFFGVGIGTIFVHSMLIQTAANIGAIGIFFVLWIHQIVCPVYFNFRNIVLVIFFIGISYGTFMVQNFTSPMIIMIFIIMHSKEEIFDARKNTESNSLLLVWG